MDKFSLLSGYHEPVLADTGAATAPARAAAEVAGEMGAGARLLAREDEERARLQEKADRMADAGSFEDVKRLMEEERGLWDNAELAAGNKPGREARWNALVSKRLGPMFRKVKFKTPEVKERARLWYDAFTSTGRIDAGRRELLASKERAAKSFKARYDFCLRGGDYYGAREAVQTAGAEGVMEPDEQQLMFQDVSFKETESRVQTAIQRDPFHGLDALEKSGGLDAVKGRPDVIEGFRKQAEAARRKAQAGVAQGYVMDAFEGREFRGNDLEKDVKEGRVAVDDAMSLRAAEERRRKAVEKMGKEEAELYTSPEDFMRVDGLLRGYEPDLDVDGTMYAEVEREIATSMLSKTTKERMMAELKDLAVGNVPARFRGAAREAASVVEGMVDGEVFGKWKETQKEGDFAGYERSMAAAYQVRQGLERWVRENPGASREEIRAQAERLAADGTGVKLSGRQNVPGVAAPEPEVKLKSVDASEVLDELGVDMNEQGNAALLPPLNGDWGAPAQNREGWRKVLEGVSMKGKDLRQCHAAVFKVLDVKSAKDVAALKRVVEEKWAWENGEK
ncbi:hypothetical protein [Akkermansia muciniphila]|jgi:hypothetical protein|uniref:hypothetical protein n=2 Tax=Akkermansia TaxID=239934 RepID=UPI001AAF1421|nr:hypothetical protein [Akkermansia muciniphila]DAS10245.1 MAG TPA: hypothetical protein [Caudoviricetes sp.]QTE98198.1 hypothetical protein J4027_11205 [Akkermansia muciniphila]QTF00512.1 hypothetical protein J4Z33_11190 [Akkermansia muciniphila]QTF02822.1 hypothetical protein J4Z36_11190 [Akkermansia muciniphila]QTF05135.1 hypothetical protein J4Z34_11200 [Akkermansia muciniphila]